MTKKQEIVNLIVGMSGKYSAQEVFRDWVRCSAIAISNSLCLFQDEIWKEREQQYIDTMKKYEPGERYKLQQMFQLLCEELEENMSDVLGDIYMRLEAGSKRTGQFFTPYHLSQLTAALAVEQKGRYEFNEPSCGGGGMIIAAAQALRDQGVDYQRKMHVVAQDLDWSAVYMCYLQLSLLGIRAVCVQGSTLSDPYTPGKTDRRHVMITPAEAGILI